MTVKVLFPQLITSTRIRGFSRGWHAAGRALTFSKKTLHAFLEPGEAYSALIDPILDRLGAAYDVQIKRYRVSAPDKSAAPEPEKLSAYGPLDAARLAEAYGLDAPAADYDPGDLPNGDNLRKKWGHYGSGMIYFEGEWFWGLDRIHHLETRLGAAEPIFMPVAEPDTAQGGEFEMFYSFRSPYSYLAVMRVFELAKRWNATVKLRPVLPMVMRALPVPWPKRFYILRDTLREAERYELPFGKICDPVGPGIERGLAILVREIEAGRGEVFSQAFLRGVFAEGLDAATDKGLQEICLKGGVSWADAKAAMADESWRDVVEANRQELFAHGHWGVPTFKVGDNWTFGQDRLWQVGRWLGG
jgi:2-hydroxychromene-2-carboxylate isomerase